MRRQHSHLGSLLVGPELGLQHLIHEILCFLLRVLLAYSRQDKQAFANGRDQFRVDGDGGGLHPLDNNCSGCQMNPIANLILTRLSLWEVNRAQSRLKYEYETGSCLSPQDKKKWCGEYDTIAARVPPIQDSPRTFRNLWLGTLVFEGEMKTMQGAPSFWTSPRTWDFAARDRLLEAETTICIGFDAPDHYPPLSPLSPPSGDTAS